MALLQIRGRNKAPVPDGMPGFGGGQVSNLRPSLLQANQSERLVNIDLVRLEDATTRRGCEQLSSEAAGANPVLGIGYYDVPGTELFVRAKNTGTLKVQTHDGNPASAWLDATGWTPAAATCDIVQGNNLLFFANGTDNLRSWDGTTFTDMGTTYPNPPRYARLLYATNRLIGWGDAANPDTLGFSNILGEGVWSAAQSLRIGAGDGDPIVAAVLWTKSLLAVFKRSSCYLVNIDPSVSVSAFTVDTISRTIGCVGPRAACRVGSDIWFMTDDGVRSLRRVLEGEDTEVAPAISYPINDELGEINRAAIARCVCVFYNDRFILAVPTGAEPEAEPDLVLPARVMADGVRWMGVWTGWAPSVFTRSYMGGLPRLVWGRADGQVWRWRDTTPESLEAGADYQDVGVDYASEVWTRRMAFGDSGQWKQGFTCEAEFNESTADVQIHAVPDAIPGAAPVLTASSAIGFLSFPISFPLSFPAVGIKRTPGTLMHTTRFRELAFRVQAAAGKMALRRIDATAFIQTMEVRSA